MIMSTNTCPFCKPAVRELTFSESDNFRAIYNRSPVLPGHSLVIPKLHYESLLDISPQMRGEMMEISIEAIKKLTRVFGSDGFNWTIQDGRGAGQTVMHLHLHLIPRFDGDLPDPGDWYPMLEKKFYQQPIESSERPQYSHEMLKKIAQKLKDSPL